MKIDEMISGKNENEKIVIEGLSVPVKSLKTLASEGYTFMRHYGVEGTFFAWGKTCSGCFSQEQILQMAS